jgi:hypothetical protein
MTVVTTLTEFLLARIAEDETAARIVDSTRWVTGFVRAGRPGKWRGIEAHAVVDEDTPNIAGVVDEAGEVARSESASTVAHIARHDPARVLAECEAKRRIMAAHTPVDDEPDGWCNNCDGDGWPCTTMAALALPYADHEAYREEWCS